MHEISVSGGTPAWDAMITRTGGRTTPQLLINEEVIGGYNELAVLNAQGILDEKLGLEHRGEREPAALRHLGDPRGAAGPGLRVRSRDDHSGRILAIDGVFVEIGLLPHTAFAMDILALNTYGEIIIDCQTRTGMPGVFAAGDVTDVRDKQVLVAAGEGVKAALRAHEYLPGRALRDVRTAVFRAWRAWRSTAGRRG